MDLMEGFVEDSHYMRSLNQRLQDEDSRLEALRAQGLIGDGKLKRRALPPARREWVERVFGALDPQNKGYIMISDFGCVIEAYDREMTPSRCLEAFQDFGGQAARGMEARMDVEGLCFWFAHEFRQIMSSTREFEDLAKKIFLASVTHARRNADEARFTGKMQSLEAQKKHLKEVANPSKCVGFVYKMVSPLLPSGVSVSGCKKLFQSARGGCNPGKRLGLTRIRCSNRRTHYVSTS